jgi:hypothetical protein
VKWQVEEGKAGKDKDVQNEVGNCRYGFDNARLDDYQTQSI